jgi:hypothetical protein
VHCAASVRVQENRDVTTSWDNSVMTEADWSAIGEQLRLAYRLLKKAVSSSTRSD